MNMVDQLNQQHKIVPYIQMYVYHKKIKINLKHFFSSNDLFIFCFIKKIILNEDA